MKPWQRSLTRFDVRTDARKKDVPDRALSEEDVARDDRPERLGGGRGIDDVDFEWQVGFAQLIDECGVDDEIERLSRARSRSE